jgi:methylglutaconyl-CoA hydratase
MSDLLNEIQDQVCMITLNRIDKHNAFDDVILKHLQTLLDNAIRDPQIKVILLKANGKHFSAGADIAWMQRMTQFSEAENLADAMILAKVMYTLHQSPKPTIAMVQGAAMGGGAGLVAACDIAIAAHTARFCFSEVRLGLTPAVISPYVVKAIGERAATWLFMSAETFGARRACELQLVQFCVAEDELLSYSFNYAKQIANLAPLAVRDAKTLVRQVAQQPINQTLQKQTASLIAQKRVSTEGQRGLQAFLNKERVNLQD